MSIFEGFVLASTDWNDRTNFIMQEFDPGVAPKRWQWISGADSDGALPVEEAHYDNAEMTVRLRIAPQANMDAALAKIGTLVLALQEAEKQALGTTAVWTPAGSTKSLTAYIVGGEVTGIPLSLTGDDAGWFLRNPAPVVTMKLYRRPFLYGAEVTNAATVTNSLPYQVLTVASVTGDVPAEARLVVTDGATQSRRWLEWGLQQRYYDAATALYVDSDNMVTSGFAGFGTTRAGADDPNASGNSVIRGTLTTNPVAVCGTGNLGHVGSYRVKARIYASNATYTNTYARLSWKEGDGPLRANDYVQPAVGAGFSEVDLGIITIPEKTLGTQRWTGQVEAYTAGTPGTDTLDVDYLTLMPVGEGYGKARAVYSYSPGATNAFDQFTAITATTVLNARTAPSGGAWATSGAATDFTAADAPLAADETETRATVSDTGSGRFAILGATSFTDTEVIVSTYFTVLPVSASVNFGIVARWVDASNYLKASITRDSNGNAALNVSKVVAAVTTSLATTAYSVSISTWYAVRVVIFASGAGRAYLLDTSGNVLASIAFQDTVLATGGALATGKPGIVDYNGIGTASTRYYDNFAHSTPTAEPIVVYSGRAAEIRSDRAQRQDSTGVYYGDMPSYRGARFYLPATGSASRTSRIIAKARRNDVDVAADDQIADSTTVAVHYTPRYLVAPR